MKLEDKIYFSVGLTVFLTIAYYYFYSFVDLYLSKLCDKYVCFKFLTYSELLAIWVALIGLSFVISSLDDWKNQYKFEKATKTIAELNNIIYLLNFLESRINDMIIKSKRDNFIGLSSIESDFKEQVSKEDIYSRLSHLEEIINYEKNNLHQKKFEDLFIKFNNLIINTLSNIAQSDLSELAYGDDYFADHNINRRKKAVEKIENILKKLRFESKEIQKEYRDLKELLHL
ncbi:hypothetical protein [Acinetobacter baumannii]|uniref:hypothetical protein n=1 Tax=Acinetobacter baumannii TaxID=470 RepID=UPI00192A9063|nr:hypothetical protein [Acinetobacter baumannii]MBL4063535.1 hypothetical protein [Acinetobacter baumannii]MCA4346001.1 hypothetical protein [Acinetobacter baumannii]